MAEWMKRGNEKRKEGKGEKREEEIDVLRRTDG